MTLDCCWKDEIKFDVSIIVSSLNVSSIYNLLWLGNIWMFDMCWMVKLQKNRLPYSFRNTSLSRFDSAVVLSHFTQTLQWNAPSLSYTPTYFTQILWAFTRPAELIQFPLQRRLPFINLLRPIIIRNQLGLFLPLKATSKHLSFDVTRLKHFNSVWFSLIHWNMEQPFRQFHWHWVIF